MTISSTSRTAGPFTGNGVTTVFPFSYKVFSRADVLVAQTVTATGAETIKVLDSDFTVTLNGNQNTSPGGIITMAVPPPVGTTLAATSNIPIQQSLNLTNNGGFYPTVINDALDRIVINIQQLASKIGLGNLNIGAAAAVAAVLAFIGNIASATGTALIRGTWFGGAVAYLSALGGAGGAALLGFIQAGVGAVARSIQDKLRDTIDWKDYVQPGDTDDTAALNRALAVGAERIRYRGAKNIGGHVFFSAPVVICGDGRKSQINFTNNDAWFNLKGTPAAIVQGIEFEYTCFSAAGFESIPHIFMDWARQIKFTKCFIYHTPISCNHMNFWNITDCEVYDSPLTVRYTQDAGEDNQVSGAPRLTANFFSASPIYLEDCVDLQATNNHFFQDGIVSRLVNWTNKGGTGVGVNERPKSTYLLANNFFDSIHGLAWDFWDVGLSSFIGNFVSAGRTNGTDGAYMYRGWHNKFIGNTFVYCGAYGLSLEACEKNKVVANDFIGNHDGGLRTVGGCKNIRITENDFGNTPSVLGGSYVQPIGFVDIGGTATNISFTHNGFTGDMAQNINLTVTKANGNIIRDNLGTPDVLANGYIGITADRPTGVQAGFGPYYDATLGIPIWYSGTGVWKNAAGVTV